jgi:sn-glycerol 3-phosphate transport system ATP-binding protein
MTAALEIEGLTKSFGDVRVLRRIDLSLAQGEMLAIVGASGCGKSTLLRLVAGLETPTSGRIAVDGRDVAGADPADRDIAMVFQNYALYPHMTVRDNMAYSLRVRGLGRADIDARVKAAAELLGLGELLARKPRQLSGGQRQRVAMGRAIVREPKLFLFDEPLSNLDAKLRTQMRAELGRLQRRLGVAALYVTHDQVEAMTLGDRLLVLHEGRPAQLDTPMAVFERPADTYVAQFIGMPAMNFLPGALAMDGAGARLDAGLDVVFADGARPGGDGRRVALGIRPEHLLPEPGGFDLMIDLVERTGSETLVHGRVAAPGEPELVARVSSALPLSDRLALRIDLPRLHVFDAADGRRIDPA